MLILLAKTIYLIRRRQYKLFLLCNSDTFKKIFFSVTSILTSESRKSSFLCDFVEKKCRVANIYVFQTVPVVFFLF